MKGGTLLTIDWDFFCYSDLGMEGLACGHGITPELTSALWHLRQFRDRATLNTGLVDEVVALLADFFKPKSVIVSVADSHDAALRTHRAWGTRAIVSLDRHHDLGYSPKDQGVIELCVERVNATNWLAHALVVPRGPRVCLFTPPDLAVEDARVLRKDRRQVADAYGVGASKRLRVATFSPRALRATLSSLPPVAVVQLTRSPEWCPPWFDEAFNAFGVRLGARASHMPTPRTQYPMTPEGDAVARAVVQRLDVPTATYLGFSALTGNPLPKVHFSFGGKRHGF